VPDHGSSGILFVLSAPSGAGKSTIARKVLASLSNMEFSISYTTRPRRAGETDGRDYNFVDRGKFEAMVEGNEFLEWAEVFEQFYGTGVESTRAVLASGQDLLLDIDVQGARQVRAREAGCVSIMLLPPDFVTLESRLRGRGSETSAALSGRLTQARNEAEEYGSFDYLVVNEDLAGCVDDVLAIVRAEHRRTDRTSNEAQSILATFPA
jgi:guanylate kinase